jgi:5-methylcytosine-specific restriction protein A
MKQIDVANFVDFVRSQDGKTLQTKSRNRTFTVKVTNTGFEYTPTSTMTARQHQFNKMERVLEQFCETGSYNTSEYSQFTVCSSYTLALVDLFLKEQSANIESADIIDSNKWTDVEYMETVKAYLWMLEQEKNGNPYSKSEVNKLLRSGALSSRTKGSIEYRMQNISAVFQELCLPWLYGYKPAVNVGVESKKKIKHYAGLLGGYNPEDFSPTANTDELEQKVVKIRKKIVTKGVPSGEQNPHQTSVTTSAYIRDPLVKAWVLENAVGICEACGSPAPFVTIFDQPFLEVHHIKLLCDGGSDTITNAIALCPNCHRRCHSSKDKSLYRDNLYSKIPRLLSE